MVRATESYSTHTTHVCGYELLSIKFAVTSLCELQFLCCAAFLTFCKVLLVETLINNNSAFSHFLIIETVMKEIL